VTVGVLVVGNMRSLSHSEHQGVVEKEQKCHDKFYMHLTDFQVCNVPGL
jgi:hypothetical protein